MRKSNDKGGRMNKQIEQTLDSREVAKMVGKDHKNLIRDIRSYIEQINESNSRLDNGLKIEPVDFFRETTYRDGKGETRPSFDITKKGCEFIAHKLTGIKGTEFTARYINRFHDMENTIREGIPHKEKVNTQDRTRIMEMNARSRMAQTYMKLAQVDTLSGTYKTILTAKAAETLAGEPILPLPKSERKVYSAGEIGEMFGITANKVGRIANEHHLKTEAYGEYRRSKSEHSVKEVDTWVYFESVIPELERILG